ncbi:MAG: ABC transporter permease subunit, partial [Gammaproteobacteria bacterium]|nr:ABC transporter permease subunit [Gammaproteobacteria bacterium]
MSKPAGTLRAPKRPAPWNDPRVRAVVFQIVVVAAVVAFGVYIVNNTLDNLARRGIASGFDFLSSEAGFGIIQTLIEYSEASSYGQAFWVGLLNTLLVSVIGIVLATLLGFIIGVARLSKNWLIARMATIYIEVFRNVPLLLQLFFWYFAVLRTLPSPRRSIVIGDSVFLNIRGLYAPKPVPEDGFWLIPAAILVATVAVVVIARWAHRRQDRT